MVEHYLRQHPLAHRGLAAAAAAVPEAGVRLRLEPACVQLCIRGDGSSAFCESVAGVLGLAPPLAANTAASSGARRILWLGPDEWLAVCPGEDDTITLVEQLESALDGMHTLVSDVGHSRVIFALEGGRAREALLKGCSLDLDPVAFSTGQCAQTGLARAHMLLHQVSDSPCYHVYAHRSFADYVLTWLCDAAREYGLELSVA